MKTPREILLEHHREAEPRLDEVRRKALAVVAAPSSAETPKTGRDAGGLIRVALKNAWMEIIWPSRRAWAGMGVLWLAVGAANLEMKNSVQGVPPGRSAPVRELAQGLEEQRRLLSELLQTPKTPLAEPQRVTPQPRSERPLTLKSC
jgi:hypothetical protein